MGKTNPTKPIIEKCLVKGRKKDAVKRPGDVIEWEFTITNPSILPIHGLVIDLAPAAVENQTWEILDAEGEVLFAGEGDLIQGIAMPPDSEYTGTVSAVVADKCLPFTITNVMSFQAGAVTTITPEPVGGVIGTQIVIEGVIDTQVLTAAPTLIGDIEANQGAPTESVPDECAELCEVISEPCIIGDSDKLAFDPCVPGCADLDLLAALFDLTDGEMARFKDMLNCGFNFLELCEKIDTAGELDIQAICDLVIEKFESPVLKAIITECINDALMKDALRPIIFECIEELITKESLASLLQTGDLTP